MIISDYNKLKMFSSITPEYDFRYFKDILKVRKASLPALPMEQEKEYINVYASPYRHVMENDGGALTVESYGTETANTLAALALIHDCLGVLDMLINRHEDIDLNRLFLLSCLYAKTDLFTRFENGAYGFDMERFLNENGTILFKYVSASGNATFFKLIYSKYYQIVINNLSDKKSFLQELISWHFITGDNQMYNLIDSIREGKYNGDL
jgi:hypothetical protein